MELSELVVESTPRVGIVQSLRELVAFRATIIAFAERDVRVKYKQAILGVGWAVLQPLLFMAIFTVTFSRFAKIPGGGAAYPAFALSALVAWNFLSTGVNFGANALLVNAPLIRKVYFPREVPVIGSVVGSGVDFAIGLLLFAVLGPFLGAHFSLWWLLAPFLGLILALLAAGVSCALAALNVYYRDFRYIVPFLLQFWLFASPVAYPLSVVPQRWKMLYVALNPAAGVIDGFRRTLALGQAPHVTLLAISIGLTLAISWLGYRLFKTLEPNFADVI